MSKKKKPPAEKPARKNPSKIRETFSQCFNVILAESGMSVKELAEVSSVSKAQLYDYKAMRKSPTTDALDALAQALKCEPSDFLRADAVAGRLPKSKAEKRIEARAARKPARTAAAKKAAAASKKARKRGQSKPAAPSSSEPASVSDDTAGMAGTSDAFEASSDPATAPAAL